MEATDLAYIAGILDGEGYIGIVKAKQTVRMSSPNYRAIVQIGMCVPDALEFIRERFGGKLKPQKQRIETHRNYVRWQLEGKQVKTILAETLPHLKIKRVQADLVLDLVSRQARGTKGKSRPLSKEEVDYRTQLYTLCKRLNAKGLR